MTKQEESNDVKGKNNDFSLSRIRRDTALVVGAAVIVGILTPLYHVYMTRALGPDFYGDLATVLALVTMILLPAKTIEATTSRWISWETPVNGYEKIHSFLCKGIKGVTVSGIFIVAGAGFLAYPLQKILWLHSPIYLILCGIIALEILFFHLFSGILQGIERFNCLAAAQIMEVLIRFVMGALLVKLGMDVTGALLGQIGAYITVLLFAIYILKKSLYIKCSELSSSPSQNMKNADSLSNQGIKTALALCAFAFLTQFDMILIKAFSSSSQAGEYAVAAFVGKALLLIPVPLVTVAFPKISRMFALSQDPKFLLIRVVSASLAISGISAFTILFIPDRVFIVIFSSLYINAIPMIRMFAFAVIPFVALYVMIYYYLAINRQWFLFALVCGVILETSGICIAAGNVKLTLIILSSTGILLMLILASPVLIDVIRLKSGTNPK